MKRFMISWAPLISAPLIAAFVLWLFSIQNRVTANEFEIKSAGDTIKEVKKDTSSILCKMGEFSECRR